VIKIVEIKSFLIEEFDRINNTWNPLKSFLTLDTCWTEFGLILAENKTDKKYRVQVIPGENDT